MARPGYVEIFLHLLLVFPNVGKNTLIVDGRSMYRSANPDAWRKQAYLAYQSRKEHYAGFAELKIGRKQVERLRLNAK